MGYDRSFVLEKRAVAIASFVCPLCQAPEGEPCWGKRDKPRKAVHGARFDLAMGRQPRSLPTLPLHPRSDE